MTLRDLPSVHEVLESLTKSGISLPRHVLLREIRSALEDARRAALGPDLSTPNVLSTLTDRLYRLRSSSLRHVVNATGVILHTNLGRAPLPAFAASEGYSNLEYDLIAGKRGRRDTHVEHLLRALLGKSNLVVNNNAAALFLILNELASDGETIVSRGELVEIGDGFRIPEIMQRSGTVLHEIGATNRTTIDDYRAAINHRTKLLLRVHQSNFRITGFTARPALNELVGLSRETGIPLYEDLGSGCLIDLGLDEPLAQDSLDAGVNVVSFSGDKLVGGPQGGIIAGDDGLIRRIRRNPLFRALRQDKLCTAAMEATLRHLVNGDYESIPTLRMIGLTPQQIRDRSAATIGALSVEARLEPGESLIGGGATPEHTLPTWLISIDVGYERKLRANDPPIIARIENSTTVLDLRTVFPHEDRLIVQALS